MITPSTEQIAADLMAGASIQELIRACGSEAVEQAVSLLEARPYTGAQFSRCCAIRNKDGKLQHIARY